MLLPRNLHSVNLFSQNSKLAYFNITTIIIECKMSMFAPLYVLYHHRSETELGTELLISMHQNPSKGVSVFHTGLRSQPSHE